MLVLMFDVLNAEVRVDVEMWNHSVKRKYVHFSRKKAERSIFVKIIDSVGSFNNEIKIIN